MSYEQQAAPQDPIEKKSLGFGEKQQIDPTQSVGDLADIGFDPNPNFVRCADIGISNGTPNVDQLSVIARISPDNGAVIGYWLTCRTYTRMDEQGQPVYTPTGRTVAISNGTRVGRAKEALRNDGETPVQIDVEASDLGLMTVMQMSREQLEFGVGEDGMLTITNLAEGSPRHQDAGKVEISYKEPPKTEIIEKVRTAAELLGAKYPNGVAVYRGDGALEAGWMVSPDTFRMVPDPNNPQGPLIRQELDDPIGKVVVYNQNGDTKIVSAADVESATWQANQAQNTKDIDAARRAVNAAKGIVGLGDVGVEPSGESHATIEVTAQDVINELSPSNLRMLASAFCEIAQQTPMYNQDPDRDTREKLDRLASRLSEAAMDVDEAMGLNLRRRETVNNPSLVDIIRIVQEVAQVGDVRKKWLNEGGAAQSSIYRTVETAFRELARAYPINPTRLEELKQIMAANAGKWE